MVNENRSKACCTRRRELAETFATTARLFSDAAVKLAASDLSDDEHVRLSEATAAAQQRAVHALVSYEEHVDSHRCWDGYSAHVRKIATRNCKNLDLEN